MVRLDDAAADHLDRLGDAFDIIERLLKENPRRPRACSGGARSTPMSICLITQADRAIVHLLASRTIRRD